MMTRQLILFLLCLALPLESWGEIYRWVDEQGKTVYSDIPKPGAEVVDLPPLPAFSPPAPGKTSETPQPQPTEQAALPYTALAIVKPAGDETIHDNSGTLTVELRVSPSLQTEHGHRIKVFLDGNTLPETYSSTGFSLADIDRGPHNLQTAVVDQSGQTLITSTQITFYMWRASVLSPSRRTPTAPQAPN